MSVGWHISWEVAHFMRVAQFIGGGISLRVDFGPNLVDDCQGGGIHGGGVKQRSRCSRNY